MIDHIELHTRKMAETVAFYRDVLAPLGYAQQMDGPTKGFGANGGLDLFLVEGEPSDVHFAFAAERRELVDQAWAAGQAGGHRTDRAPALAPHIHPNYYAGYLRDPDGRLIEFVCQQPD